MDKSSENAVARGFFSGSLQKATPSAGVVSANTALSPSDSESPTSKAYPAMPPQTLQQSAVTAPSGMHSTAQKLDGGSCATQKMGYRQCLEFNPDDKVNCTWALDNYLKCRETQ